MTYQAGIELDMQHADAEARGGSQATLALYLHVNARAGVLEPMNSANIAGSRGLSLHASAHECSDESCSILTFSSSEYLTAELPYPPKNSFLQATAEKNDVSRRNLPLSDSGPHSFAAAAALKARPQEAALPI
jgi:hypothetical protein